MGNKQKVEQKNKAGCAHTNTHTHTHTHTHTLIFLLLGIAPRDLSSNTINIKIRKNKFLFFTVVEIKGKRTLGEWSHIFFI